MRALLAIAFSMLVSAIACGAGAPPPSPTALPAAELKYRLIDRVGRPWFCDPDTYPIARADEAVLAARRIPEIQRDAETFAAILAHLGINATSTITEPQQLAICREYKALNALALEPAGGSYRFQVRVMKKGPPPAGALVEGAIDRFGTITIDRDTPAGPPVCPICLAAGTFISTPDGEVPIERVLPGMPVWTIDTAGGRAAARVMRVASTPVPRGHQVVHLALSDGRQLFVSPGHPTADGRLAGELAVGDALDRAIVVKAERVGYAAPATFDLLPSGFTGTYWASGVALRSTLRP